MTIQPKTTVEVRLPDSAPFSSEQRDWLSGFFTGVFSAEFVAAQGVATPDTPLGPEGLEDDVPWKDASMPLADRQKLAEGKPLPRQLYAAMAQQDCGQCGYLGFVSCRGGWRRGRDYRRLHGTVETMVLLLIDAC
jgi:sulfite reductase (NADPH) flavoprotein alpha-component